MTITVLGAGSFGCAIASVLSDNKHTVNLWDYSPESAEKLRTTRENPYIKNAMIDESINITSDLDIINSSEIIVIVVPSFALRETAKKINSILTSEKIIVVCTKGIEAETMDSGHAIIEQEVSKLKANVILSGPTHAEEIAFRKYTTIVSTSTNTDARELVQQVFSNNYLRVYTNDDVMGVEILGAAKNVLAIAAGFCDSNPNLGDNAKAALLTRGLRELKIIGDQENCNPETFYGLTGLGDLIVTATSPFSRNRRFGELLGTGLSKEEAQKEIGMVVEGLYSVKAIHELMILHNLDLPIINAIYMGIYEGTPIEEILGFLLDRGLKSEV